MRLRPALTLRTSPAPGGSPRTRRRSQVQGLENRSRQRRMQFWGLSNLGGVHSVRRHPPRRPGAVEQHGHLRRRHRGGEEVALSEFSAEVAKSTKLFGRFDPFGEHCQVHLLAERDNGLEQGVVLRTLPGRSNERLVDLEESGPKKG